MDAEDGRDLGISVSDEVATRQSLALGIARHRQTLA